MAQLRAERIAARISYLAWLNETTPREQIAKMRRDGHTLLFESVARLDWSDIEKLFGYAIKYAEFKREHGLPFKGDTLALTKSRSGKYFFDNAWDWDKYK